MMHCVIGEMGKIRSLLLVNSHTSAETMFVYQYVFKERSKKRGPRPSETENFLYPWFVLQSGPEEDARTKVCKHWRWLRKKLPLSSRRMQFFGGAVPPI